MVYLSRGACQSSIKYLLLFKLLWHFESIEAHSAAMLDLRNRILPSNFLSEFPGEAAFCFWLQHPEPSSRPTTR
ncbi:SPA1-RELATED 2 [Olea europaea subsp. europaea]|uniref:SPA1-RELATED 2 n=1 Tax=Olea europaea subsp. europaea TaxID=158383 RepID=A0A8S0PJI2_OLEEU|nr:SPA1-RELATED 2 [Olea europaea subsp. europaea]